MRGLLTFAMDEGIGGVGARLIYPNETIQHAGMAAGVLGPCTHTFIGEQASKPTYQNWASVHRECSMVTGAVFATRTSILSQINGFDERFALNFNDVDLCLRLRSVGYRIVYTPHAELTHYESASRGKVSNPADQTALFMEKWQDYLRNDPAYHPRLTRSTSHVEPVFDDDDWWIRVATSSGFVRR
jgi:GT2 family glycosyltransferase